MMRTLILHLDPRTYIARIRFGIEGRRRALPAGCTRCGHHVVRYVYADEWRGQLTTGDSRCEDCGPADIDEAPAIDYGYNRQATVGQAEDDLTAARPA